MDFELELAEQIGSLVPRDQAVIVAVSGGPDSTALLVAWSQLADQFQHRLHVAHFDHRFRPDSALDAQRVEDLARKLDLPFHQESAPDSYTRFTEESGRKLRYAFLGNLAQSIGARYVATGHTRDDRVETVLLSILRGTGLHGLAGIPAARSLVEGVTVVRPLLQHSRASVGAYLQAKKIDAAIDPSNDDLQFLRNRIRRRLLPLLRSEYNPKVDDALVRFSELAQESSALIARQSERLYRRALLEEDDDSAALDLAVLRHEGEATVCELLRWLFCRKQWPRQRMGRAEYRRVGDLVFSDEHRRWDLPDGVSAERTKNRLRLYRRSV